VTSSAYIQDILTSMGMTVLPITADIAELSQNALFTHGDPADRLIAATALAHRAPLITADEKLRTTPGLHCIW
jgi:PIN domain nuclease of toxin-antitoxin system